MKQNYWHPSEGAESVEELDWQECTEQGIGTSSIPIKNTLALILIGILILSFPSCSNKETKPPIPQVGEAKIFAVVLDTNGRKIPAIVVRLIKETIKTDSSTNKKSIVYDSLYGIERIYQTGLDSLGKPKYATGYFLIGKDSVNTNVSNIPLDSLTKK